MSIDPDFHPLSAKWLEGQAGAPEQAVLNDIFLTEPTAIREFAALCRTEILLRQAACSEQERRQALADLLSEPSWPKRLSGCLKRRFVRRAAAAAAIALGFWPLARWAGDPGHDSLSDHRSSSFPALRIPGRQAGPEMQLPSGLEEEPEIDPALRQWLRRMPVVAFAAHGPLSECVAAHFQDLKDAEGHLIPVKVLDEGDSAVSLEFKSLLPTWHLLRMTALQTGTELSMEDGALTFRKAAKPASLEAEISRLTGGSSLNALLRLRARETKDGALGTYARLASMALGSGMRFEYGPNPQYRFSGSERSVKVLDVALEGALALPPSLNLAVTAITIPPPDNLSRAQAASTDNGISSLTGNVLEQMSPAVLAEILWDPSGPALKGICTAPQTRAIFQALLSQKGARFEALWDQPAIPNLETVAHTKAGSGDKNIPETIASIFADLAEAQAGQTAWDIDSAPASKSGRELQKVAVTMSAWNGQSLLIGAFQQPDGSLLSFVLTAQNIPGKDQASGSESSQPFGTEPESMAKPVSGKPGFVTSPYSDLSMELDVSRLQHGSSFTCPLTGRKFRIP